MLSRLVTARESRVGAIVLLELRSGGPPSGQSDGMSATRELFLQFIDDCTRMRFDVWHESPGVEPPHNPAHETAAHGRRHEALPGDKDRDITRSGLDCHVITIEQPWPVLARPQLIIHRLECLACLQLLIAETQRHHLRKRDPAFRLMLVSHREGVRVRKAEAAKI